MRYTVLKYSKKALLYILLFGTTGILAFSFYSFYHLKTVVFGYIFINPFYEFINNMFIWVYTVLCSTVISLFSFILFISLSLFYNIQKNRSDKLKKKYFKYFSFILTNYFFTDFYKRRENEKRLRNKIKSNLKNRIQIIAFIESYLKIQETVALNLSDGFKELITKLNIKKKLEYLIFNANFDDKILAMKMLSYLRNHDYDKQIMKYAQSKNISLRTEAYAALIRLMEKDEHLVKFIGEKHNLSMLDINIIVNAVLKNRKMNIDYQALLSSNNPRKIMVGLLLAKYRYRKNRRNLILILNHIGNADKELNKLAWDALMTLVPEDEAVDIIIDKFNNEPDDVKLLILENLNQIQNQRFFDFLNRIMEDQSLLVKIDAMKIIFNNDFNSLVNYENSENPEILMAYKEVSCVYN